MNREDVLNELACAHKYLNKFDYISGTQVKMIAYHLVKALDKITSYAVKYETSLEKEYLVLSRYRLFKNESTEKELYDIYFYLKNLLDKSVVRLSKENVKIVGYKYAMTVGREFFQDLISRVELIAKEVFSAPS